jgi:hypothetical protein
MLNSSLLFLFLFLLNLSLTEALSKKENKERKKKHSQLEGRVGYSVWPNVAMNEEIALQQRSSSFEQRTDCYGN